MKTSEAGIRLIKSFESFSAKAYLCPADRWTIGWGSTFLADGSAVTQNTPNITVGAADALLANTLSQYELGVLAAIKAPMTQCQFDACVCLAYNVGVGNFKGSSVAKRLNAGDIQGAADAFLLWNKSNGKVLPGLERRRRAEKALFLS